MKKAKVAVTQRVVAPDDKEERRDALDQRLCRWLIKADCIPLPIPNCLTQGLIDEWLSIIKPDLIVLSGGNDIGEATDRDFVEYALLDYAEKISLPVYGICRGMQIMSVWAGGNLVTVPGHVRTRHRLQAIANSDQWPEEVNSFHNFSLAGCPNEFIVTAISEDQSIEAIRHINLPWEACMWHPEREGEFDSIDLARINKLLYSRNAK